MINVNRIQKRIEEKVDQQRLDYEALTKQDWD